MEHHVTGITVYPDSADSLADGIVDVLDHPDWAAARAQAAYELVHAKYNWTEVGQQTFRVMQRVVAERAQVDW